MRQTQSIAVAVVLSVASAFVANATGAVSATSYTTRINLGGPLSPIDADGAAIIIHQNPDTNRPEPRARASAAAHPSPAASS